ncbi:MAG: DUF1161 domain-containing protein [Piscinibacter sp.]|nr:DUF1161 domain-containing protein [Piscinibacter sp.]
MRPCILPATAAALALLIAGTPSVAQQNSCDSIRAQIEAKIRKAGATRFTLQVVDAAAKVDGKTVGTCDLGTKKIVYQSDAKPGPAGEAAKPPGERILTECKDGTVTYGDCKQ